MEKIRKRLKSKRGETLVESLVSILIFTFASVIMFTMVTAAADINNAAREADRKFFDQMIVSEMAEDSTHAGHSTVVFTVSFTDQTVEESVPVDVYGGQGNMYAYYAAEPQATEGGAGG